jgi:hypothetical protein
MALTWWTGKLWNDYSKNLDKCRRFVGSGIIANALDANKWMKLPLMFWCAPASGKTGMD